MAAQVALQLPTSPASIPAAKISIPSDFHFQQQDSKLKHATEAPTAVPAKVPAAAPAASPAVPLGVLGSFTGTFAGRGFNTIFRPNSGPNGTTFPNPVNPPPPNPPSENVLELNLTLETLSFSAPLGSVPNRGLETQSDIFLNGVPYVQAIQDVTNPVTGKADGKPSGIHFEPGLWMRVPATKSDPALGESLVRMGSIPHGTTINAQCLAPTSSIAGPPQIPAVDITPFPIGFPSNKIPFASQTASNAATPRLPQDLSKFIATGMISQAVLTDPNTILRGANQGRNITKTTVFTVATTPTAPELGGGTANIAFLEGVSAGAGPNASAAQMSATFWVEEVQSKIEVPVFKLGDPPLKIPAPSPHPGALVPTFEVTPPHAITAPKTITVTSTQIQYSQTVFLNFAGITWPHVSCATLIPQQAVPVPASAFN